MGRSRAAVRQLASRARRKVHDRPESPQSRPRERTPSRLLLPFWLLPAAATCTLMALLAPDAVMQPDQAGQVLGTGAGFIGARPWPPISTAPGVSRRSPSMASSAPRGSTLALQGGLRLPVRGGVIREVELIADPSVLSTMKFLPQGQRGGPGRAPDPRRSANAEREGRAMKTMACSQLGGPSKFLLLGNIADEVIKAQDRHLEEVSPTATPREAP